MLTRDCITSKGFEEYAISPREHFANLYAKLIAFSIAERMNMPESVSRYYKHEVCVTLYNPYLYNNYDAKRKNKNTNEPIIEYFNKINKPIDMNLEFVNNLDFMNRIIFGFGISDVEFEYFLSICNLNGVEPNKILKQLSKYSNMDESIYKNVGNQSQTINKC